MPKYNRLFIPEKASVGKALAEYLSKTTKQPIVNQGGFVQVGNDVIAPMSGHLLEQVQAHEYDPKYKSWALEHLPIVPSPFRLAVKPDDPKRNSFPGRKVRVIKELLSQCAQVIGFGDPDAEGQLLQDELLIFLGNRKPVLRLWSNALDDTSMQRALANMKPNEDYVGWYEAALSRSQLDWLYGINMTRACTLHARAGGADMLITIGRVQTPTLALVVERELAIRNFKPVDFYLPFIDLASAPSFRAKWRPRLDADDKIDDPRVDPEGRLLSQATGDSIAAACEAAGRAHVAQVDTKPGTEAAPLPFALSALQAHCSRLFGFSAKQTLDLAQALYLKKVTSYPRVDCGYLPESQHADAPRILSSLGKAQLPSAFGPALLGARPQLKSKAWDDSKVTAHHAIVPMHLDNPSDIAKLDPNELKVYLEIVKRYILQFWAPAKFTVTEVLLKCGKPGDEESFVAKGRRYQDDGWRKAFVLPKDDDEDPEAAETTSLPPLSKGQTLALSAAGVESKRTQPPKRFTDGTLVTAMKHIYLHVKDPEYRKRLQAKEGGGIGTEATRAPMIDEMCRRSYLSVQKKELVPSEETIQFITMLPGSMKAPDMTAMWNLMTDDVMARKSTHPALIAKMVPWLRKMVESSASFFAAGQFAGVKPSGRPRIADTSFTCFGAVGKAGCGAPLRLIPAKPGQGGYRAFFGCTNQACKKTFNEVDGKPVERPARGEESPAGQTYQCESCKVGFLRLVPRRDGSGSFWGCSNYRNGCRATFNDARGSPDLAGVTKKAPGGDQPVDPKHPCPVCSKGFLARRERKDKSGHFWGCTAWREGCKAIFNDAEGAPDVEGTTKKAGWQNGAPPQVKPRNSGHSSGYRGGRPVTPQMHNPTPK